MSFSESPIIAISGIDALDEGIRSFNPDVVCSVYSPSLGRMKTLPGVLHQHLIFADVEDPNRRTAPTHRHIAAFLWLLGAGPRRLLVHCGAGLSRSPALAVVAAVYAGRLPEVACSAVRKAVPAASPNRLVLSIASQALGIDLQLAAAEAFNFVRAGGLPVGAAAGFKILEFPAGEG